MNSDNEENSLSSENNNGEDSANPIDASSQDTSSIQSDASDSTNQENNIETSEDSEISALNTDGDTAEVDKVTINFDIYSYDEDELYGYTGLTDNKSLELVPSSSITASDLGLSENPKSLVENDTFLGWYVHMDDGDVKLSDYKIPEYDYASVSVYPKFEKAQGIVRILDIGSGYVDVLVTDAITESFSDDNALASYYYQKYKDTLDPKFTNTSLVIHSSNFFEKELEFASDNVEINITYNYVDMNFHIKKETIKKDYVKTDFSQADYDEIMNYIPSDMLDSSNFSHWDKGTYYANQSYEDLKSLISVSTDNFHYMNLDARYKNKHVVTIDYNIPKATLKDLSGRFVDSASYPEHVRYLKSEKYAYLVDENTKWSDIDIQNNSTINSYQPDFWPEGLDFSSWEFYNVPESEQVSDSDYIYAFPKFNNSYVVLITLNKDGYAEDEADIVDTVLPGETVYELPTSTLKYKYLNYDCYDVFDFQNSEKLQSGADDLYEDHNHVGLTNTITKDQKSITVESGKAYYIFAYGSNVDENPSKPDSNNNSGTQNNNGNSSGIDDSLNHGGSDSSGNSANTDTGINSSSTSNSSGSQTTENQGTIPTEAGIPGRNQATTVEVAPLGENDGGIRHTDDIIKSQVEEVKAAAARATKPNKQTVNIDMTDGAQIISASILKAAKGRNVDIVLDFGTYKWTINGYDIKASKLYDVNLVVEENVNVIPSNLVQSLANGNATEQISLRHEGNFGFKGKLTLSAPKDEIGKFGNLYWYNTENGMEFMDTSQVTSEGLLNLAFSHASDYLIVFGDKVEENNTSTIAKVFGHSPKTFDGSPLSHWRFYLMEFVAEVFLLALVSRELKKEMEEE